jgi:hypothetical protein
MPSAVRLVPHAMILSCSTMNWPAVHLVNAKYIFYSSFLVIVLPYLSTASSIPMLNMRSPSPVLDMINTEPSMMLGVSMCHLYVHKIKS